MLRHVVSGLSIVALAGCTAIQPVARPDDYFARERPPVVRVVLTSGSIVAVEQPRLSQDQLVGRDMSTGEDVALRRDQIHRIEARQSSSSRTVVLGLGIAAATAAFVAILLTEGGAEGPIGPCGDPQTPPC